ncbi:uncharacterized protein LOC128280420 [Gossypium arboreum]|uniref:uncharacterized protein LOC128280420 n=1 Tax=Gossypium arboreum TaxID=29729 RepID=UPI0022F191DF|nr:uncharacterized protein LOC128280420 [Gossypium arboreum]
MDTFGGSGALIVALEIKVSDGWTVSNHQYGGGHYSRNSKSHEDGSTNDGGKGSLTRKRVRKYLQGGTQILELKEKKDRFGLGFKPDYKQRRKEVEKHQEGRRAHLNGREVEWELMTFPPISQAFISRGLLIEESHQINAIHDEGLEQGNLEGRATYQRAMVNLFHDMMHKEIKVYVDDMIAKSQTEKEHIEVLRKLFLRLRKFQLELNPVKCIFGARSGKLLGFMVSERE